MKNLIKRMLLIPAMVLALVSAAQVPILNSITNPPANIPTIYLDFDGHTFTGTPWNVFGPITCQSANLNTAQMTEIFNRVAEDYRPFQVNITTDAAKFTAAPLNKRMRVVHTITSSWYGNGAGGVSMIGSFSTGDDTPCFVFTALLNYNIKNISEAAAHEAGHTLGLYHQSKYDANCVLQSDYHSGNGSGEIGWAPIMGVGYYRNMTVWHNGPNPYGCSQMQNDLSVITSVANGITYRADDHNSAFAQATGLSLLSNQFTVQGIVEQNTDQDLFRFTLPEAGRFVMDAIPYNVGSGSAGSDLDMQVSLYDNSQTLLNVFNPGTLLSSVVDTTLNAGNYYFKVEGKGNINAPAYASLGSYSLQGRFTAGNPLPLRRLELTGALKGNRHSLNWDIEADEQVTELSLEISTNGRNFEPLHASDIKARAFTYTPYNVNNAQYRLNVTFDNGRSYYSNIVSLRGTGGIPKPQLTGNILYNSAISVSSPGNYQYTVLDINGKLIIRGKLGSGLTNISAPGLVNGMYFIHFTGEEGNWVEKFVRQ